MVVADQIVVDGFRDVDAAQWVIRSTGLLADDANRVRRVVASDVEEVTNAVRLEHVKNLLAVSQVRLVARAAQSRRGRGSDEFEVVAGLLGQVDKILVDDATNTVPGTVDQIDRAMPPGFEHDADQALVDHRGGAAALGDEYLVQSHGYFLEM